MGGVHRRFLLHSSVELAIAVSVSIVAAGSAAVAVTPSQSAVQYRTNAPRKMIPEQQPNNTEIAKPCPSGYDNRSSDLCAQWKAADAAKYSAEIAFWIGIAGSLLGCATLVVAVRAAMWAKKAAIHTETGAKASAESAEHAARSVKAAVDQHRAWLKIDNLTMKEVKWAKATNRLGEPEYVSATLTATVKNVGATPATNISYEARIWAFPMMANYSEWYEIWDRAVVAHKVRVKDSVEGWVLFPGDVREQKNGTHTSWNAVEGEVPLDSGSPEFIRLMGIVTVVYRIASGDEAYTSVPFLFDRRGEANPWTGKSLMEAGEWRDSDVFLVRVHHGDRAT